MNKISYTHSILQSAKYFYEKFNDCNILYDENSKLIKLNKFKKNINRVAYKLYPNDIKNRLKFLGDAWEFFALFYMSYIGQLQCKNVKTDKYKKFFIDVITWEFEDFGTDFYILHDTETVALQCKYSSKSELLDPRKSKIDNFLQDALETTDSMNRILFSVEDIKYTINESLTEENNFYSFTLRDVKHNTLGIDIISIFERCILGESPKIEIKQKLKVDPLLNLEPSVIDLKFSVSDTLKIPIRIDNNLDMINSQDKNCQDFIIYYIISKFYSHLGNLQYDTISEMFYLNSIEHDRILVFQFYKSSSDKISANKSHMSYNLNKMDKNFGKYDPKLVIISNVDNLFEVTHNKMSRNKVLSVINYEKLLTRYNFLDDMKQNSLLFRKL